MEALVDRYDLSLDKVNGTVGLLIPIDLGKTKATIGINPCLLVDSTQALDSPHIEGILTEEIAWIIGLDMGFFFLFYLS